MDWSGKQVACNGNPFSPVTKMLWMVLFFYTMQRGGKVIIYFCYFRNNRVSSQPRFLPIKISVYHNIILIY